MELGKIRRGLRADPNNTELLRALARHWERLGFIFCGHIQAIEEEPGACPFNSEIHDDHDPCCVCCDLCSRECGYEV